MLDEFEKRIKELRIIPSKGGVFEIVVDGELLFSKKGSGRHTEMDEVVAAIRDRVKNRFG